MITGGSQPKVIFSVINCICFDQRVQKMAEAVQGLGCEITIVGRRKDHNCDKNLLPFRTFRFRMIFKRGFLFYKFFNIRLFLYLIAHRSDVLVANDLDTLLPNFLVSRLKGIPLVYDSHELFTAVPELNNRPFVKSIWSMLERSVLPRVKHMITVSDSIADYYSRLYRVEPAVIRNAGRILPGVEPFTRAELGFPDNDLLLIMQGTGINIDKGAEELVDAVATTEGICLLIVGSGDVISSLREKVRELNMVSRIRFFPAVMKDNLARYTKAADAGVSLEKDTNLNYRYSIPNKLFDYIASGIPVIATDLPEISVIVREYDCGILLDKITPDAIAKVLSEIRVNRDIIDSLRNNAVNASKVINWETESLKVTEFYKKILETDGQERSYKKNIPVS